MEGPSVLMLIPTVFFWQVMSAGAIPVFVGRDIVRPFREQIDWPSFSFIFTPDEVYSSMVKTLRAVPLWELTLMQVRGSLS